MSFFFHNFQPKQLKVEQDTAEKFCNICLMGLAPVNSNGEKLLVLSKASKINPEWALNNLSFMYKNLIKRSIGSIEKLLLFQTTSLFILKLKSSKQRNQSFWHPLLQSINFLKRQLQHIDPLRNLQRLIYLKH